MSTGTRYYFLHLPLWYRLKCQRIGRGPDRSGLERSCLRPSFGVGGPSRDRSAVRARRDVS